MKCPKCQNLVSYKANYCEKCGYKFTEEEKKEAYSKTLGGKLEKLEEAYSWISLSKITGSLPFKIVSLLMVLFIGISTFNKAELYINKDDSYTIQYNSIEEEYYLIYEEGVSHDINLNIPSKCEYLTIEAFDEGDYLIDSFNISKDEGRISLSDDIYSINIIAYGKNKELSELRIRLYQSYIIVKNT